MALKGTPAKGLLDNKKRKSLNKVKKNRLSELDDATHDRASMHGRPYATHTGGTHGRASDRVGRARILCLQHGRAALHLASVGSLGLFSTANLP